jgi:hypothetical protein
LIPETEDHQERKTTVKFKVMTAIFALALVVGVAGSAGASKASAATGPAYCGAINMVHDAAMGKGFVGSGQANDPMVHDLNGNGNAGMTIAVGNSCP